MVHVCRFFSSLLYVFLFLSIMCTTRIKFTNKRIISKAKDFCLEMVYMYYNKHWWVNNILGQTVGPTLLFSWHFDSLIQNKTKTSDSTDNDGTVFLGKCKLFSCRCFTANLWVRNAPLHPQKTIFQSIEVIQNGTHKDKR